jgi:formylglycine-generating enzyme required for sulfatase activity
LIWEDPPYRDSAGRRRLNVFRKTPCEPYSSSSRVSSSSASLRCISFLRIRRKARQVGPGKWYDQNRLHAGPFRELIEESSSGGRVTLAVIQVLNCGSDISAGPLAPMTRREHIDVVMLKTPEGWKVEKLDLETEILVEVPEPSPEAPMAKNSKGRRVARLLGGISLLVLLASGAWFRSEISGYLRDLWRFESLGKNAQGFFEYRHRQTEMVFVKAPGGTFLMGSPPGERDRFTDRELQHEVTLRPFLIAKHEVTQAAWLAVMGAVPPTPGYRGDDLPVWNVSWEECEEFCRRTGFQLPSEAQWEYACRAGGTGPFAGDGKLDDLGWYSDNSRSTPHPVGKKKPNGFGLHDVHGNVWEWCLDWYQTDYYGESAGAVEPLCANASSGVRVVRGGSWEVNARFCRSAYRGGDGTGSRYKWVGFRPAGSLP